MPNSRLYFGTTSGGETTASNIGIGEGIFSSKVGSDLQFKSLIPGSNVSITSGPDGITISATDAIGVEGGINLGAGAGLYKQRVSSNLEFKSIIAGTNVTIIEGTDSITISSTDTGEVNTASNLGTGTGSFAQKIGTDLQFKSFVAGTNVSITSDAQTITISATDTGEVTTASNIGVGEGTFAQKVGVDLEFKTLVAGDNVSISSDAQTITISADAVIDATTASNLGAGEGSFAQKVGDDLQFKSLVAGNNVSITSDAQTITIDASSSGEANTASNIGTGIGAFAQKVGVDLEFKSFIAGSNISLSSDSDSITVTAINVGEINTASNIGPGQGSFAQKVGNDLQFKTIVAGSNVSITSDSDTITISSVDNTGVENASNLGSGEGLFSSRVGDDLRFKSLVAGTNITLTGSADSITIDASGAGEVNTASNIGAGTGIFAQKVGVDLEFKSLVSSDYIQISSDSNNVSLSIPVIDDMNDSISFLQSDMNILQGQVENLEGDVASLVILQEEYLLLNGTREMDGNLNLGNYRISNVQDPVDPQDAATRSYVIANAGEINTASNVGAGLGLFSSKVGSDLQFKSIIAGTNITITEDTDSITINSSGGGGGNPFDYVQFNLNPGTIPSGSGILFWDEADGNQTLSLNMAGGNVVQQIGQEIYIRIKASSAIQEGQSVMITGTVGTSGVYEAAPAANVIDGHIILGVATENIAENEFGYITELGLVRGIVTDGSLYGETWIDGDELYWNPNPLYPGGLTNIKPSAPNVKASIGSVLKASSGNSGSIYVRLNPGSILGGTDSNVQIGTLNNNDFLVYDLGLGYWKNVTTTEVAAIFDIVSAPDATETTKGILKLTGDLGGTADFPTVPSLVSKLDNFGGVATGQYEFISSTADIPYFSKTLFIKSNESEFVASSVQLWGQYEDPIGFFNDIYQNNDINISSDGYILISKARSGDPSNQAYTANNNFNITPDGFNFSTSEYDSSGVLTQFQAICDVNGLSIDKDGVPCQPASSSHVTTKEYVDAAIAAAIGGVSFNKATWVSTISASFNLGTTPKARSVIVWLYGAGGQVGILKEKLNLTDPFDYTVVGTNIVFNTSSSVWSVGLTYYFQWSF